MTTDCGLAAAVSLLCPAAPSLTHFRSHSEHLPGLISTTSTYHWVGGGSTCMKDTEGRKKLEGREERGFKCHASCSELNCSSWAARVSARSSWWWRPGRDWQLPQWPPQWEQSGAATALATDMERTRHTPPPPQALSVTTSCSAYLG